MIFLPVGFDVWDGGVAENAVNVDVIFWTIGADVQIDC